MKTSTKALFGGTGAAVVAAGIALSGGTSAFFYDVETSTGNSAEACDFDLTYRVSPVQQVGTGASQATTAVSSTAVQNGANGSFTLAGLQPGDSYAATVNVRNAGSCAGDLYMAVDSLVDSENGVLEPEAAAGDTSADTGELSSHVDVVVRQSGWRDVVTGVTLAELADSAPVLLDGDFTGRDEHTLRFTFTVPDGGAGAENVIMTDSAAFDLDVAVIQDGHAVGSTL